MDGWMDAGEEEVGEGEGQADREGTWMYAYYGEGIWMHAYGGWAMDGEGTGGTGWRRLGVGERRGKKMGRRRA